MVSIIPDTFREDALYSSREVCEILKISESTLSRYVSRGYCTPGRRPGSQHRVFPGDQVLRIWRIVY